MDFFSKCEQIQFPADLVSFTEEILDGKLHFLCNVTWRFFKKLETLITNSLNTFILRVGDKGVKPTFQPHRNQSIDL